MKVYQNKNTGVMLRKETYKALSYSDQLDYVKVEVSESSKDNTTDLLLSGVIGYATDSALLGGLLGGSLEGGIIGDLLNGGDLF